MAPHQTSLARRCRRARWTALTAIVIVLLPISAGALAGTDALAASVLKAAFLYNFAKFTEWPSRAAPLVFCVVGDADVATALIGTVRGQKINGRPLSVSQPQGTDSWRSCSMLYLADADAVGPAGLGAIRMLPVLTVSDDKGFSQGGGIIELYVEGERMRFAVNVDAADRSGLKLSSRLLGLAKVVRDSHVQ